MSVFNQVLGLILSLSILVFVHELGHFFFARLFKTRVEKFYLFFNPWFSILRFKKVNGKYKTSWFSSAAPESWKEFPETTEWGIGWLPLGGYCSIAGMVDETKKADELSSEPKDYEYRSKPAWQRLLIISGGIMVNFLVGIVLYITIAFQWGNSYIPLQNVENGLYFSQTARQSGFEIGDKIISINDKTPKTIEEAMTDLLIENVHSVKVMRNGEIKEIDIPKDFGNRILASEEKGFVSYLFPTVVDSVIPNTPASLMHLQSQDSIVGVNNQMNISYSEFQDILNHSKGQMMTFAFYRNDSLMKDSVKITDEGKLGFFAKHYMNYYTPVTEHYGFFKSIPVGIEKGVSTLETYVKQFKLVFSKEGATQLGGFGTIGGLFPKSWDWYVFWSMTALLSIILAFMNFLPIPALDGGYFLFIIVEIITGKKPSDKFLEYANMVGFILLMALLIWANGLDILRLFK